MVLFLNVLISVPWVCKRPYCIRGKSFASIFQHGSRGKSFASKK